MSDVVKIYAALPMEEGSGAKVKRLFPVRETLMNFDPFVLWDHFSLGRDAGFPPHPHRGFEIITYLFEGAITHGDNLGNQSTVTAGGVQQITAGKGIVHSEMPGPEARSVGIQLWVNLPGKLKKIDPHYQLIDASSLPEISISNGLVRTIAGEGSPVSLHTPVKYFDVQFESAGRYAILVPEDFRGFVYVVEGEISIDEVLLRSANAAFFDDSRQLEIVFAGPCRFMVCIGSPHREPIIQNGPFVD